VVIENGVITQIGTADELLSGIDPHAEIIDLDQRDFSNCAVTLT
jgi:predicted amidohydrolase YtcJ